MAAHTQEFGACALFGAKRAEPCCAIQHDGRNIAQCFDIIDYRWLVKKAMRSGVRWLDARKTAFAFNGFKEGSFFTANISPCAASDFYIKRKTAIKYILTDKACGACFVNGRFKALGRIRIFAANKDITFSGINGKGGPKSCLRATNAGAFPSRHGL